MKRSRLSKRQLLEYARLGAQYEIGCHPAPNKYPDDVKELEQHVAEIDRRIKLVDLQASRKDQ